MMNYFKKKSRSLSPAGSVDMPKLSLPKWMRSRAAQTTIPDPVEIDVPSIDDSAEYSATSDSSDTHGGLQVHDNSISSPRIRSSSFDVSRLQRCEDEDEGTSMDHTLQVPTHGARSKSFDAAYCNQGGSSSTSEETSDKETTNRVSSFLNIPKYYKRRSLEIPRLCIHCVHLETLSQEASPTSPSHFSYSSKNSSLCTTDSFDSTDGDPDDDCVTISPDVSDNEAFTESRPLTSPSILTPPVAVTRALNVAERIQQSEMSNCFQDVVTLQVPILKPRSSSMDAAYMQNGCCDDRRCSLGADLLDVPVQPRSSSVDVSLPTEKSAHYTAIPSKKSKGDQK